MTFVTPTDYEKLEWARLAQAAYAASLNSIGTRYSVAASRPRGWEMAVTTFDGLQSGYREWLIGGFKESVA